MSRWRVTWRAEVLLTVDDDTDVLTRTQTKEWRDHFYHMTEEDTVEMIARCCGVDGSRIDQLDGWADLPNADVVKIDGAHFGTALELSDAEVEKLP